MSERKVFIAVVIIALGFALACGSAEEPSAVEPDSAKAKMNEVPSDAPGPIVDLDPDPDKETVFAWYATPPPGEPGFPHKAKLIYKGSLKDPKKPEAVECDFREDFIGGEGIETFNVWGEDDGQIVDASKVLLQSKTRDGKVKIEITIEKDVAGKRLNWVVDDLTDRHPACKLVGVKVKPGEELFIPEEFKDLELKLFREISTQPRIATDFRFGVRYKVSATTE